LLLMLLIVLCREMGKGGRDRRKGKVKDEGPARLAVKKKKKRKGKVTPRMTTSSVPTSQRRRQDLGEETMKQLYLSGARCFVATGLGPNGAAADYALSDVPRLRRRYGAATADGDGDDDDGAAAAAGDGDDGDGAVGSDEGGMNDAEYESYREDFFKPTSSGARTSIRYTMPSEQVAGDEPTSIATGLGSGDGGKVNFGITGNFGGDGGDEGDEGDDGGAADLDICDDGTADGDSGAEGDDGKADFGDDGAEGDDGKADFGDGSGGDPDFNISDRSGGDGGGGDGDGSDAGDGGGAGGVGDDNDGDTDGGCWLLR
jgi:hypothetical protein